jgi:excisionase family DNA binding protein
METLLTTEEIADYLRVDVVTVRRLVSRGELPAYRIGSEFRFMAPDIEAFVRSQRVSGPVDRALFDKFTERSRKVLTFANEEAGSLGHNYIGTEHILLGLVHEGEGVAALALIRSGLSLEGVRESMLRVIAQSITKNDSPGVKSQVKTAMQNILGAGQTADGAARRNMTARATKVIELAVGEAHNFGHHYVGTEHILLGILSEGEGLAAKVLVKESNLQLEAVRSLVLTILQEMHPVLVPSDPPTAE